MVGHQPLELTVLVRIQVRQPPSEQGNGVGLFINRRRKYIKGDIYVTLGNISK